MIMEILFLLMKKFFYVTITDDLLGEAYIRKRIDKANDDFDLFNDKRDIYYLKQKNWSH